MIKQKKNIIPFIMITSGLLLIVFGILANTFINDQFKNMIRTPAKISDISNEKVYVSYTLRGKTYDNIEINYYSDTLKVGQNLEVYINPAHPEKAQYALIGHFLMYVFTGIGAIFIIIGIIATVILHNIFNSKDEKYQSYGTILELPITYIGPNNFITINNRHPFIVKCDYHDPITNKDYTFKSHNLWRDPSDKYHVGDIVKIYIQNNNYKKHYIEIGQV